MKTKYKESVLKIETEWLRQYASTYIPSESGFEFPDKLLRREGINLVEIRNAMRRCIISFADKLEGPGALWIGEGPDDEEERILFEVTVISEAYEVRLRSVKRLRVKLTATEEGSNDAA